MTPAMWQQVESLFAVATASTPADADEMLRAACGDHAEVRDEVLSLVQHARRDDVDEFLPKLLDSIAAALSDDEEPSLRKEHQLGPYLLEAELGRGGMGVVYRARHIDQERVVALKTILGGRVASVTAVERFYVEARAAANLDHPHIVPVYDVAKYGDVHCFSMALIDGGSLADRLAKQRCDERRAVAMMKAVAEAVDYAHSRGVVHRDLKPANILLDADGSPRITDFGLALRDESDDRLTATGEVVGTLAYMAPEQARGDPNLIGPHSDQYSLGVVLYELLTGRTPYLGKDYELLRQVANDEPPPLRKFNRTLSKEFEAICLRAMHRDPERRYKSVGQFAQDLGRYLAGEPVLAKPIGRSAKLLWLVRKQLNKPWVAAGVTAVIVIATLWLVGRSQLQPKENRPLTNAALPTSPPPAGPSRAQQRTASRRNLERLGTAVCTYSGMLGTLVPAAIVDKDGRPLLSWRVHMLPLLGHQDLFQRFKLDEPWDSENNKQLLSEMPDVYAVEGRHEDVPYSTRYQVVTGPGTAFDSERRGKISRRHITDGLSNTLMLVEASSPVPWTQPVDVNFAPDHSPPQIGSALEDGIHAVMFDGSVCYFDQAINQAPDDLAALFQIADGRLVPILKYLKFDDLDVLERMAASRKNLQDLAVAVSNYHDTYHNLPPPFLGNAEGQPLLSWRVAILPFLGEGILHDRFHLDEAWDSDHNKSLLPMMPRIFEAPGTTAGERDRTHYQVYTGTGAVFDPAPGARVRLNDIADGTSKTVLIVEAQDPVPWTKPQDLPYAPTDPVPEPGGLFPDGFHACMVDGSVHFFSRELTRDESALRAVIQYNDGKDIRLETFEISGEPFRVPTEVSTGQGGLKRSIVQMEVDRQQQAARQSRRNLHELAIAMLNFHDNTRRLPPAASQADNGQPLLSWRVALLPYLDEANLHRLFHHDEPWDSEHNKQFLLQMPDVFRRPTAGPEENETFYQLVTGPGTAYEPDQAGPRMRDIRDGSSNTMMIVEAGQPVPWTKPADVDYDLAGPLPKLGGIFREGFHAVMFDGHVMFLFGEIYQDEPALRSLIGARDGVSVDISPYIRR